jgi:hypothetical protein
LLLVLGALSLGGGLICLLLTIHTLNKRQKLGVLMSFFLLGSGFSLALYNALCRAVPLSL